MNTSLLGELNESFNKEGNELGQRPLSVVVHAKEHTDYNQIDVQTSLPIISISSFPHLSINSTFSSASNHPTKNETLSATPDLTLSNSLSFANHSSSTGFPVYPHSHSSQRASNCIEHATHRKAARFVACRGEFNEELRRFRSDWRWERRKGSAIAVERAELAQSISK